MRTTVIVLCLDKIAFVNATDLCTWCVETRQCTSDSFKISRDDTCELYGPIYRTYHIDEVQHFTEEIAEGISVVHVASIHQILDKTILWNKQTFRTNNYVHIWTEVEYYIIDVPASFNSSY